jgi:hypothetical protein
MGSRCCRSTAAGRFDHADPGAEPAPRGIRARLPPSSRAGDATTVPNEAVPRRPRMLNLPPREDASRPRRGWYAYRVTGAASLPSWAAEVALAVERPVDLHPEGFRSQNDGMPGDPLGSREVGSRNDEVLEDPRGSRAPGAHVQATVLLRAAGRANWSAGIVEAAAEVEAAAGVRRVTDADRLAERPLGARSRLRNGPSPPGLVPISPAVAQAHLGTAGARGLAAPMRRWRPAAGSAPASWEAGAGAVLTCDGPSGVSAQAVVALRGAGRISAITPPPGGALVLRAWRTRSTWGAACGLVLGAAEALGLGREAQRIAAGARAAGWDADVLHGLAAMHLARAGDHRQMAPEAAARAASSSQVAALFEACLTAGGLGRPLPAAGQSLALAVTP